MRKSLVFGRTFGLATLIALATWVVGQAAAPRPGVKLRLDEVLGKAGSLSGLREDANDEKPIVHLALTPSTSKPGAVVTLSVTVVLPSDAYTYSTNPAGPGATHIGITDAVGLEPQGDFEADRAPKSIVDPVTGKPVEKFERVVTWLRPYVVTAEKPEDVRISGTIDLKYCNPTGCRAFSQPIHARLVSAGLADETQTAAADSTAGFTKAVTPPTLGGPASPARLTFVLSPKAPKSGDKVTLAITMNLEAGWHTYSTTQKEGIGSTTTKITLTSGKSLRPIGDAFQPDRAPELTPKSGSNMESKEVYHGEVTWTRRFQYEPKAPENGIGIEGKIHYGICNESQCLPPHTESFKLGDVNGAVPLPKALPDDAIHLTATAAEPEEGFWLNLGALFLGGMILNVMPCVLPVLAIKVLSFVQQAGESRSRIFLLNVAYTAGVLSVFLTLATLAVGTRLGLTFVGDFSWGGLFQQTGFNLVMACVVFAMGLSLLGVFEIPVPGMVGSAAGGSQHEGFPGAFLTGIFATLLATPCLGPFLGTAIFWSLRQSTVDVYLAWGVMGLGMAAPYLALGIFPQFIKWLPKPGTWMIRFKEFSGFVLLASVIFIVSYTDKRFTIPALVMLLGVALALWMIGNLYDINSHIRHKLTVRTTALVLAAVICWIGYGLAGESKYRLAWEPFSETRLAALMKENKTVLVDFTADWCLNCHLNEAAALNTKETKELVEQNGVVPLLADFTNQSPEIKKWLEKFKQVGVPLTVIFPGGRPTEPIVLRSSYFQGRLSQELRKAVAQKPVKTATSSRGAEEGPFATE